MGSLKLAALALLLASPALAQSSGVGSYGIGRAPTPDELRALDISISPTGDELPPGHGSAKEGAALFQQKGCSGCHGKAATGGLAPELQSSKGRDLPLWERGRGKSGWSILPLTAPYATIVWDYIHRGMPLGKEGTLTPDEVYALTAYLLFLNGVIPEDQVLDKESLPKVKMPIGNDYARLPEWKHGAPRLAGYPY
jgi:mono/diheme cytochrome c family protein